jgi:hypothetical protein
MSFSPLHRSKSVMEVDEMEDAPLLSLLAEGCEGSQLADSGTVSGSMGDAAPGLEPCAGCGLLMNHDYYCVGCGKSIHWFVWRVTRLLMKSLVMVDTIGLKAVMGRRRHHHYKAMLLPSSLFLSWILETCCVLIV